MKAKVGDISNTDRVDLADAIPLNTPFVVFISPSEYCNLKCSFCPINSKQNENAKRTNLDFDLFGKFVDDAKNFPEKIKVLRFIGNGEPTINKKLPQMVAYAKRAGIAEKIMMTTNGTLLTPRLTDELIEAGLDLIKISLEAVDTETFNTITKTDTNIEDVFEKLRYLYEHRNNCEIYIKTTDIATNSAEKKQMFFERFGEICDYIYIENVVSVWPEYGNGGTSDKVTGLYSDRNIDAAICVQPFKVIQINSDGMVSPCCVDWQKKIDIGNINNESIVDIWNGEKLRAFQINTLRKELCSTCKSCSIASISDLDNLDNDAAKILAKLTNKAGGLSND